jgi:hypothetical protein
MTQVIYAHYMIYRGKVQVKTISKSVLPATGRAAS